MKIAIHESGTFGSRWVQYCKIHNIDYKVVNVYDNDIIKQIEDCDAFMWHHHHANYKDVLFAKQLLFSLQQSGKKVFPNFYTGWHFDDKVAQKYLLESVKAPLVPSYVFYSQNEAILWAKETTFPKVFKLRGGAGASNVKLVRTKAQAYKVIKKAFGKGFTQYNAFDNLKERWRKYRLKKTDIFDLLKGLVRFFIIPTFAKMHAPEKGYVYFQDFIPNNKYDIRVCVVGDKAFAIKRMVRKNDFRASGSGNMLFRKEEFDEKCIKIAFEVNDKLKAQNIGYDFVFCQDGNPLIVEISYGYAAPAYDNCEGYWTRDMVWHPGNNFDFCGWMVEDLLSN